MMSRRRDRRTRATCHPDRPHAAKGLCHACYELRRQRTPQGKIYRRKLLLRLKYGITYDVPEVGLCAICGRNRSLKVDHDHETNEVRGFLCNGCNMRLGWFEHNKESILRYLDAKKEE